MAFGPIVEFQILMWVGWLLFFHYNNNSNIVFFFTEFFPREMVIF